MLIALAVCACSYFLQEIVQMMWFHALIAYWVIGAIVGVVLAIWGNDPWDNLTTSDIIVAIIIWPFIVYIIIRDVVVDKLGDQ